MTLIIGLTGGIGSGKTAASDRFASHGITVVDADIAARIVVEKGKPALTAISEYFGDEIILPNGNLNRAQLRKEIFNSADNKQWLEALLHPLIRSEISRQLNDSGSPYTLLVSPLLIESDQQQLAQRILVVDAPEQLQVARTVVRDDNSETQVKAIMASQTSRETRLSVADDIIVNDSDMDNLNRQVDQLHQHYLTLAQQA